MPSHPRPSDRATPGDEARIDLGGIRKTISVALIDSPAVGDYVIVHVGFAIGKLDAEEAQKTLAVFAEMGQMRIRGMRGLMWGEGGTV